MKLHQKGFLLVQLSRTDSLWDASLIDRTCSEYCLSGNYTRRAISIALDELASAGLIQKLEEKLTTLQGEQILSFRYRLSDFGRQRMQDTGLLNEETLDEYILGI